MIRYVECSEDFFKHDIVQSGHVVYLRNKFAQHLGFNCYWDLVTSSEPILKEDRVGKVTVGYVVRLPNGQYAAWHSPEMGKYRAVICEEKERAIVEVLKVQ